MEQTTRTVISRKQYARLTDLLCEFFSAPSKETDDALLAYQEAIGWPWKATQEQVDDWNGAFQREARRGQI